MILLPPLFVVDKNWVRAFLLLALECKLVYESTQNMVDRNEQLLSKIKNSQFGPLIFEHKYMTKKND